jgi:hypothetical protein
VSLLVPQRRSALDAADDAEGLGAPGQSVQCLIRATPCAHRVRLADLPAELDQRLIDFVLDERGACRRRAFERAAAIDDCETMAISGGLKDTSRGSPPTAKRIPPS